MPSERRRIKCAMQQVNDIRERAAKPDNIIYLEDGTPAPIIW